MDDPGDLLTVSGVSKSYSALVLSEVGLQLRSGEVHALVGENGAGKSTLARVIAGLTTPDAGQMRLRGVPFAPASKQEAEGQGVRLVMQELNLIRTLTVAENVFLDQLPHRLGWIDYRTLNARAHAAMTEVGLGDIDPTRPVQSLGVGQQQLVEIATGLSRRCDVLILDEPTAALTDPEIDRLFVQLEKLRKRGAGIIYISHRLEEIQRIADRITVLRDGQIVATRAVKDVSLPEVVQLMVGRQLAQRSEGARRGRGALALRVEGLRAGARVEQVSFDLHRGEILGFAGLMGSGRTETVRAIFGADPIEGGDLYLHGASTPVQIGSPSEAVRLGLALVTEDRKSQGLLLPMPVRVNTTLTRVWQFSRNGFIRRTEERLVAARWADALKVRCTSIEQPVNQLSGGNQQKVVIAKWLLRDCEILMFDEPTRGIDVGAKFEIYELLADLAAKGKAVLVVSSDLKELLAISDRIAVMSAGRVAGVFERGEWSEEKIMAAAFTGYVGKRNHEQSVESQG